MGEDLPHLVPSKYGAKTFFPTRKSFNTFLCRAPSSAFWYLQIIGLLKTMGTQEAVCMELCKISEQGQIL